MKSKHRFIGAFATLAFAAATGSVFAAAAGQPAPDFTLTDTHGKAVHLSDYRGKYVVLEWTNPDCPFVQRHYNTRNMPQYEPVVTTSPALNPEPCAARWLASHSSGRSG